MSIILIVLYKKRNAKPDIVDESDHFLINMDINVLYPPLDVSLDCFDFTKLSMTFPTHPHPVAPTQTHQQKLQQQLAPSDASLVA